MWIFNSVTVVFFSPQTEHVYRLIPVELKINFVKLKLNKLRSPTFMPHHVDLQLALTLEPSIAHCARNRMISAVRVLVNLRVNSCYFTTTNFKLPNSHPQIGRRGARLAALVADVRRRFRLAVRLVLLPPVHLQADLLLENRATIGHVARKLLPLLAGVLQLVVNVHVVPGQVIE